MHGRGRGGGYEEERKPKRHMWTEPTRVTAAASLAVDGTSSLSSLNSFCKDGRKISVGDCALFKPPQDSPPFIGIIRWLTTGKENKLKLGFCSFLCRRVYDITNKCLWWLTDQDYINERQEEVDELLQKTRIEMQATVQQGGRSPKPTNGPASTSQLKPCSDCVQHSASSFPSQVKGKKRERGDQGSEPVKRERSTKMDEGDSGHSRPESIQKSEIPKITEKGGLVDSEGVEKLVQLMLLERNGKKIDLISRSMLTGVIAATDRLDCLSRFVQLGGLPVFDEWLQEVHKGKIGDSSAPKDSDKSIEDFLLILLRALDKLPVNLHALQMCNIGKSVNHLRTHKNLEIQKKARSLVDTWKKRVEAEMDAKSGLSQAVNWPARSRLPEVSHVGSRHSGGSSEVAIKSSVTQLSASKIASVKLAPGESTNKSVSPSLGTVKSAPSPAPVTTNLKDGQPRNTAVIGALDLPLATAKDERSSSSSQSHNNSQSCSSDHAKTGGFSGKEDARRSTAGSMNVNKISGSSSRHRKSVNGFSQKESVDGRSSLQRNPASEKLSQSSLTGEKTVDVPVVEANIHKLIVKIPTRGRSPVQSGGGGSFEDPSVMNSRASSPVISEKHDQFDHTIKDKSDAHRASIPSDVNTDSWQSNDFKNLLAGSEGEGSPATVLDEEHCKRGDDGRKMAEVSKAASSSAGHELKSGKLHEASFSSMNALIESCAKYSEANESMSGGDNVGMNLLASVAAGEMSKSDVVSSTYSPQGHNPVVEHSCTGYDSRVKSSPRDDLAREPSQSVGPAIDEREKQGVNVGLSWAKNIKGNTTFLHSEEKPAGELCGLCNVSSMDLQPTADNCPESNGKLKDIIVAAAVHLPSANSVEKTLDGGGDKESEDNKTGGEFDVGGIPDIKQKLSSMSTEDNNPLCMEVWTEGTEGSSSHPSVNINVEKKNNIKEGMSSSTQTEQKEPTVVMHMGFVKGSEGDCYSKDVFPEKVEEVKSEKADETGSRSDVDLNEKQKSERESNSLIIIGDRVVAGKGSVVADLKDEYMEQNLETNEINGSATSRASPVFLVQETEQCVKSRGSKLSGMEADEAEECTSTTADASSDAAGVSNMDAKVGFDLNEGFDADDGKYGELNNLMAPGCSAAVQFISPLPFPVSSVSTGLLGSITVTAAAKGAFYPPEDLFRNKGELGWKGSAATSAFRPAEPRKALDIPLGSANLSHHDAIAGKPSRPPLDIDLNVADERIFEDFSPRSIGTGSSLDITNSHLARNELMVSAPARSSGGLDLDLNRVDEPTDMVNHLTSNGRRLDVPFQRVKSSSGGLLNGEVAVRRDFDLNDGPVVDELSGEPSQFSQHARTSMRFLQPVSSLRMNNPEMRNFSSWFSPSNTYSAVKIPSILPDRGEQPYPIVPTGGPQRMFAPPPGSTPFSPDVYRGSVLSSSPAVPFPSTSFQYPVFPFGTGFPPATFSGGSTTYMDSSSGGRLCFPAVHYRPYVVSLPDGSSNGGIENSRKWVRQGLDLNAGPGGPDIEGRDETSALATRQLSVASSQALAEEQARMFQVPGSVLKRKEPDGGWDGYKQSSWQ
ncbi:Med26 domain-containing protein [Cephalotus follicularis]|uniref:Med26 domain-containing protein n=1 Tax=Cephalotus follicularis TaxID=3775 RepID=A0A1Q3DED6_CEPFO|nr:Med26 domain-containing protein [Cephalotus follicularis]